MILKAIIDDKEYSLEVPEAVIAQGEEFFSRLVNFRGCECPVSGVAEDRDVIGLRIGISDVRYGGTAIDPPVFASPSDALTSENACPRKRCAAGRQQEKKCRRILHSHEYVKDVIECQCLGQGEPR